MRALSSSTPAAFRPNIPTESDKKPSSSSSQAGPSTGAASTSGQVVSQGGEHIVDIEQLTPEHESGHEGQGRDSSTGENQQKKLDKSASLTNGFKVDRVGRTGTGDALFHAVARNLNAVVEPPVTGGHAATAKTLRAKIAFYQHEHKAHLMQDEKFKAMLSKEGKNIDKAFDKLLNFSERTSNQWGIKLKDKKTMPSLLSAALNKDISVYRPSSSDTSLKEDFNIKHAELFGTSTEVDDAPPITLLLSKKANTLIIYTCRLWNKAEPLAIIPMSA